MHLNFVSREKYFQMRMSLYIVSFVCVRAWTHVYAHFFNHVILGMNLFWKITAVYFIFYLAEKFESESLGDFHQVDRNNLNCLFKSKLRGRCLVWMSKCLLWCPRTILKYQSSSPGSRWGVPRKTEVLRLPLWETWAVLPAPGFNPNSGSCWLLW